MPQNRNDDIDIGLSVLVAVTPPGVTMSSRDIAEVCGCWRNSIDQIEKRALKKLARSQLKAHGDDLRT